MGGVPSGVRRVGCALSLLLGGTLFASGAEALLVHYDTGRETVLRACDDLRYRGDEAAATTCYEALLEGEGSVRVRADAAAALGDVRTANRLYREATSGNRDAVARTRWARLYLQTHQTSDAEALYREALLLDPDYLPARTGLAEATSEGFEGRAREALSEILAEHPDDVHALVLLAGIELELQNIGTGRELLDRALAAAEAKGFPPLEMYALHAGANLLENEPLASWTRRALDYNPGYGDVYAIPARFYIITYRYREAVDLYRRAVALDDTLATAHRDLGINLLRINDVFGARHHLQRAFELDPFDVLTVNTLRFLDGLDDMRVTFVDVPYPDGVASGGFRAPDRPTPAEPDAATNGRALGAGSGGDVSAGDDGRRLARSLIRLDRDDADALEPYVRDLIVRAVQTFSERYDFRLARPMVVELYHDHDDFGVRTVSTPGIGLLGVTFGYLTAMDSPRARTAGEFHWGSTLWHEIAHVFTLEATGHRLPRWFSEGLSVYEEWNTGPLPDRELPLEVIAAIRDDQLLPIVDLDRGFVRPSYRGQVQVSYMQAGLICDFIAGRWGHEALVSMLKDFAERESTAAALEAATGLAPAAFDAEFAAHLDEGYGEIVAGLEDYQSGVRQLGRAVSLEDWISVEALARDLVRRYPARIGRGNAYELLAEGQRRQGDEDAAVETLLDWHARGGHEPATLQSLAAALRERERDAEAAEVLESLNWVMPYASEAREWLGTHYLARREPERARREFEALLGLRPEDPAAAWLGLARASHALGERASARRQVLYALESAPFYRPAQQLLLELVSGDLQ